jgi:beta-ribofuranosylaminobenzene 5'-phosphate synthase
MTATSAPVILEVVAECPCDGDFLMKPYRVRVEAASRLHLGLLSLGQTGRRQYGGVGLMVASPGLVLLAERSEHWTCTGPHAERLREFAASWRAFYDDKAIAGCHLRLLQSSPQHVGLGTGTQLGLAVAAALYRLHHRPLPSAETLAAAVGRGNRSSVGTHGFLLGGLIIDRGKLPGQSLGTLAARVHLPDPWRVVQLCPPRQSGLSGADERRAFDKLPAIARDVTERLWRRVDEDLLPSAEAGDFDRFSRAVYEYGHDAGLCFVSQQGGPFASALLAEWIGALRQRGVLGVGQSSWGPTLFAFTPDSAAAEELVEWAQRELTTHHPIECRISRIANRGARLQCEPMSRAQAPRR